MPEDPEKDTANGRVGLKPANLMVIGLRAVGVVVEMDTRLRPEFGDGVGLGVGAGVGDGVVVDPPLLPHDVSNEGANEDSNRIVLSPMNMRRVVGVVTIFFCSDMATSAEKPRREVVSISIGTAF